MKFTPKKEEEISGGGRFENLPPGEYPFTVMESSIQKSKSEKNPGKEFVKLKICVHGPNCDRHVFDQFADWFSEWKLKHFCETVGRAEDYARGSINPQGDAWKDMEGYCKIKVIKAIGEFPAKNEVSDYLPDEAQKVEALSAPILDQIKAKAGSPIEDEDTPF
jgi:hypothetical protein